MTYSRLRNFTPELRAQLAQLLPEAFQDGQLNLDILRQLMGEEDITDNSKEHFELTWVGKRDARKLATAQPVGALIPAQGEGINEDTTQHIFIEGENLETLRLLRQAYTNKIKMIYIDPPYNTGNDFIYKDDFSQTTREYLDTTGENLVSNPRSQGRFHANWLSFIYPRLRLAKDLLREDGVIFVSIDDNEVHNLRQVMDEIFGAENFVANIVWKHTEQSKNDEKYFSRHNNTKICYRKSENIKQFRFPRSEKDNQNYSNPDNDSKGLWRSGDVRSPNYRSTLCYNITSPNGKIILPPENGWRWSEETLLEKIKTGEIIFNNEQNKIIRKIYLSNQEGRMPENVWIGEEFGTTRQANTEIKELFGDVTVFDTPKPTNLVKKIIQLFHLENDYNQMIILDFFAGSGTTAQAVLELNKEDGGNRKFICVQIPEKTGEKSEAYKAGYKTIAEITKERIRRVIAKLQKEQATEVEKAKTDLFANQEESSANAALDLGFKVYKLQTTNIRQWQATEPQITPTQQELEFHAKNPFTDSATNQGILAELQLNEGFPLHSQAYRAPEFTTNEVWRISSDYVPYTLFVCLDNLLNPNTLQKIKQVVKDSDVWICKDTAFGKENDSAKVLLAESCQLKTL